MTTTRSNPVDFPLRPGDILTIVWSGEPRTVTADTGDGGLILRDLTEAEAAEMAAEAEAGGSQPGTRGRATPGAWRTAPTWMRTEAMSESPEAADAGRDAADAESAFARQATTPSRLFADWAKRQGILSRITEDQCADLALAFFAGWAHADAARGHGL